MMEMTLGERIRKARKGKMTQAELAHAIGVHEMTIRRWESGLRSPRMEEINAIADKLGIPVDELIGKNGQNSIISVGDMNQNTNTINNEQRTKPRMAFWGNVLDSAKDLARIGNREDISAALFMLKMAVSSLDKAAAAV